MRLCQFIIRDPPLAGLRGENESVVGAPMLSVGVGSLALISTLSSLQLLLQDMLPT